MNNRLYKLALFLFLGAIINVAVAWLAAVLWQYDSDYPDAKEWAVQYGHAHWLAIDIQRSVFVDHLDVFGLKAPEENADFFDEDELRALPKWSRLKSPSTLSTGYEASIGWPMRALWCSSVRRFTSTPEDGPLENSGIQIRRNAGSNKQSNELLLPLRPIWPGFASNTIFYAVILWLLWSSPFTARRFIRRKRGLCIKCGYDLHGTSGGGCPECGWEREAEA